MNREELMLESYLKRTQRVGIVVQGPSRKGCGVGRRLLERYTVEGYSPVCLNAHIHQPCLIPRVGQFGNAALIRWYTSAKAKYWSETDSEQVV